MSNGAALALVICWTIFVALVTVIGVGFAGGVREAFVGNIPGVLFTASPIFALGWWLRRRNQTLDS